MEQPVRIRQIGKGQGAMEGFAIVQHFYLHRLVRRHRLQFNHQPAHQHPYRQAAPGAVGGEFHMPVKFNPVGKVPQAGVAIQADLVARMGQQALRRRLRLV